MIKRIITLFWARNLEFVRDRASLSWNLAMPFMIVLGLAVIFGDGERDLLKIALYSDSSAELTTLKQKNQDVVALLNTPFIHFFTVGDWQDARKSVARHRIDLLINVDTTPPQYVMNEDSAKSFIAEKLLLGSDIDSTRPAMPADSRFTKSSIKGQEVSYLNWVMPGVLGMNIMFGCLFGVGWVIVRYRKNGYLKRLEATPISAFEFIVAQILSRLIITLMVSVILFLGCQIFIDIEVAGSYLNLFLFTVLGSICMIAFGLLVASRTSNEELASGLLNLVTWPMMLLSELWFSLEGSPEWVKWIAQIFPLTHYVNAVRGVMIDGKDLLELSTEVSALLIMSAVFLLLGCLFFQWNKTN